MPPAMLLIKPASGLCNMRCKYCFYDDVTENREIKSYGIMEIEPLEILVQKALKYSDEVCGFVFQGGEPTLAGLDYFKKLIEFQKKYNIKKVRIENSIQTNGYIIDEEWAEFFAQNSFMVGLSIDGIKDTHDLFRVDNSGKGTFEKVMKAAKLLEKYNVEFNILCVVNNVVARHGGKIYNFFKKNNFKYLQFIPCLNPFDDYKNYDYTLTAKRYADFLKTTFDNYYTDFISGNYISIRNFDNYIRMISGGMPEQCGMSGVCNYYFVIEGDGSVYPCDFYVIDKYKMGNITENSFEEMMLGRQVKAFVDESKHIDPKCLKCEWINICKGGCRRNREPFINGKPGLNIFCDSYLEFFKYSFKRMVNISNMLHKN